MDIKSTRASLVDDVSEPAMIAGANPGAAFSMVEAQNHFLSRISHEMRNTLATIKTAAYCLKDDARAPLTARQSQLVEMISRNVDRQKKIVENILDLAHLRSGKLKVRLQPVDMSAIITDLAKEYTMTDGSVRLKCEIRSQLPLIQGDADLITQVLRNLTDNASRYARQEIVIKASDSGTGGIAVSVTDDGAGIPRESLGRLFTQFVQLDQPGAGDVRRGTGLGLAICQEIINCHDGRIWAENAPGHGARVTFTLPAPRASSRSKPHHK